MPDVHLEQLWPSLLGYLLTRQGTGAPYLTWGRCLIICPDEAFHIHGLDFLSNRFLFLR